MPDSFPPQRVFLDTNVIISATRLASSRFLTLWRMTNVALVISPYVIQEALDHLQGPALLRFEDLPGQMQRVEDADSSDLPYGITVVEKDLPVLAAAVSAHADFLLTGDKNHFGHLYGTKINATTILAPGTFLNQELERIRL